MYIYNNVGAKLQISIYTQQHYRKICFNFMRH